MLQHYHLGCPIWGNRRWAGTLYTRTARPADFLRQYAAVFNTVEGNTTFYSVPSADMVARWVAETPDGFRFSFKFPRSITHDGQLVDADAEVGAFLERLAPLGDRLGPFMIQLPPGFGPNALPVLEAFLGHLPADLAYAVEVRHPGFFDGGPAEVALDTLLEARGVDRVIFDTRPLRAADPADPDVRIAQQRKPNLPVRVVATGPRPILRYIAHADISANEPWLAEWVGVVAGWIAAGRTPYVFVHAPDDFWAPQIARRFHTLLAERAAVGEMPPWPGETEGEGAPPVEARQLGLFD
jgi:uncharacterized protein YecE (DUF72 family)